MSEELFKEFENIISDYSLTEWEENGVTFFSARIGLKDSSKLSVKDHLIGIDKRKYAYQWMKEDNTLIIRWDNAPHHPQITTFPDHKHVEKEENIQTSEEMNLKKVLKFIAQLIGSLLLIAAILSFFSN